MLGILKQLLSIGVSFYKTKTLTSSIKHSTGITLVLVFLLGNGYISKEVFDILIKIAPSITFLDFITFGTLLSLGYVVWLSLDILKAYKNYLVKKIEAKEVKSKDTTDCNIAYRNKEFKDIEKIKTKNTDN